MSRTADRTYRRNRRRAFAESDTCFRCGQWIDPDIKWPHPMSKTADHVHAIKDGGDNHGQVRPAHFRCNVQAGNRKTRAPSRHSRAW